jgi:hypothetical protein
MTKQDKTLQPEHEQAIALILAGETDQAIADAVGVTRQTVNGWRNHHPEFIAELNQRRAVIWEGHTERLRGMAAGALDTLEAALQDDDPKEARAAAVHILKACGLYGQSLQPQGMIDPEAIAKKQTMQSLLNSW